MLSKEVCEPLIELSIFFSVLGSKELKIDNLNHIEAQIPITLCKLEKVFPPSFFDVMVHLPIHLASEAMIAGPIHYRWMYPVERWLYFLKSLIGNRACPEGSIAEGYIAIECMTLCSRFHVEDYDKKLRTQNCDVVVLGENDKDSENLDYYGVLTDVIELQFVMDRRVVLFRCNWFDMYDEIKGVKKDEYDFVSVNPGRFLKINEPFVLANQASQVFYANDNSNKGWLVVMKTQPRDSFETIEQMNDDDVVELGSPSQKKRKRTSEFKMKLVKTENEDSSTMKSTLRYTFVAPGSIGKGRGRGVGLKSLGEKGNMPAKKLFSQSNDLVNHYIQEIETRKTRGLGQKSYTISSSQGMETMRKNSLDLEKENMKINIPSPTCTNQVKQYTKEVETTTRKGIDKRSESTMSSKSTRSNTTKSPSQEMQKMDRNPLVSEKDDKQINISLPPSTDQVMKHTETTEKGSPNPKKVRRVRGSNMCKEVAALEIGQKLKVTFYNNRTVGTNSKLFSRHLGKIIRDRNICPLGVSSWNDIKQEKLNHMWAAVEARSNRNAANRAKLTMLHHIGSKPIREIIYQKGGKDGNPPDLATIFFETRKKDNKLVEPKAIEKHAQLQEIVQTNPSLPSIEIVEKCCGPQTRSHVFGFGGGVKANDLKGGTSSKAELFSALRSSREDNKSLNEENKFLNEENKSLNDQLSTVENEIKEIMKMKELFAAQQSHVQPATSFVSTE
ncbi:hypothetical protein MTR67_002954 [Solanum verrucosum]|uniref:DUF4216 domain-containing protein n=1 Tax=Solanum verrucosum TaxID=315347 RepID=A0AAF0PR49_SOLVR|nr:hypothetical protein MTR67_002954 [Solanum verrucosum]